MRNLLELQDKILPEELQPKFKKNEQEIVIAIASLAIGGAEMIVTDWLHRISQKHPVHLIVLRNKNEEWSVPSYVKVTRVEDGVSHPRLTKHKNRISSLQEIGARYSNKGGIPIVCHLLNHEERTALKSKNNFITLVLHNSQIGWNEKSSTMNDVDYFVCVSDDCARALKKTKLKTPYTVVKHIPKTPFILSDTRSAIKKFLKIPPRAKVIGMVGSFKIQKNYLFALKVFERILEKEKNAYLVILGGASSTESAAEMYNVAQHIASNKSLKKRVRIPGVVKDASSWICAFDLFLNTSHFEGLSIATLEAMSIGTPCLLSKVGGQGEIVSENTELLELSQSVSIWARKAVQAIKKDNKRPNWADFPSFNLWTLVGRINHFKEQRENKVLFVTSNLNLGGAQRSLVNLLATLPSDAIKLTVAGNSTSNYFYKELTRYKVTVSRGANGFDCYENASNIITDIYKNSFSKVVFWNVDPKLKLLLTKFLAHESKVQLIDVSPGYDSYYDMERLVEFSKYISFPIQNYYKNLKYLVSKFQDSKKARLTQYVYIPNGVSDTFIKKTNYKSNGTFKIVVSGRIVETKFLLQIIQSFYLVLQKFPKTELHIYGSATNSHGYLRAVMELIGTLRITEQIFFHGKDFQVMNKLHRYDMYIVLGENQGSPNSLLEAMSVGMPCIANDSGGCREIIKNNENGILIRRIDRTNISKQIITLLRSEDMRKRIGTSAVKVAKTFSMKKMSARYRKILEI